MPKGIDVREIFFLFFIVVLIGCSGRGKRAALQQDPASTNTDSVGSVDDLDSFFETTDPFATDPSLDENAINGTVAEEGGVQGSSPGTDPFADFFGSAANGPSVAGSDVLSGDPEPTTGSILDPLEPTTDNVTALPGLNGLATASENELDLNSILNSVSATPASGSSFNSGGGVSQILQMTPQLFQ